MPKLKQEDWKEICNSESQEAFWEITHDSKAQTVRLIFVPDDDRSANDIDIKLNYEQFEDLCKFINRISKPKK
jgi:hypothetical protein